MFKEIPLRKCIVPLYTNIKTGTSRLWRGLGETNKQTLSCYPVIIGVQGISGCWQVSSIVQHSCLSPLLADHSVSRSA